jgi:hypothetical protein
MFEGDFTMKVLLFVLATVCLFSGCEASYNVGVNGYSSTGQVLQIPYGTSITVVTDSNAPNPILEREIRTKIETILSEKGFSVKTDRADYYLVFNYGIDSGRAVTGAVPVWYSDAYCYYPYGYGYRHGYVAYAPYTEVVYTRWLVLKIFDEEAYRASKKVEPLWIGEVTSVGLESDLRELLNYMLIVGFEHFGQDTGRRVSEVISEKDERIRLLR